MPGKSTKRKTPEKPTVSETPATTKNEESDRKFEDLIIKLIRQHQNVYCAFGHALLQFLFIFV